MIAALQSIASALAAMSPLITVNPDEQGVRVRCGKVRDTLLPGLYWKWPVLDAIITQSVVDTVADLNTQSLTTADMRPVCLSGRLRYRIVDVAKAHFAVYDIDDALIEECEAAVAGAVMDRTLEQAADREDVEEEILEGIQESVRAWGVRVEDFSITNFVPCRTMRLLQD